MQSTQQVKSTNKHIKTKVNTKTSLLNLEKAIQMRLECEFIQDIIKNYLTLESISVQNEQISQSILYCACLFEISKDLTTLSNTYEYMNRYLEDEYDALQALLKNIMNMINYKHILEIWKVLLFDHYKHSSNAVECDKNEEMNQVIFIRGSNAYQTSIHTNITKKQEYIHSFGIAKCRLKFMTVDVNQIENLKKSKYKERPRLQNSAQKGRTDKINIEDKNCKSSGTKENLAPKIEAHYCDNCYEISHYV
ncbi:25657_t:CDS:2, partial [Racocetra persica]